MDHPWIDSASQHQAEPGGEEGDSTDGRRLSWRVSHNLALVSHHLLWAARGDHPPRPRNLRQEKHNADGHSM